MSRTSKYSPEVKERAVRMVVEHESEYGSRWAATKSIASKISCSAEVLCKWVQQAETDQGRRPGLTTDERKLLKELEVQRPEHRLSCHVVEPSHRCPNTDLS